MFPHIRFSLRKFGN